LAAQGVTLLGAVLALDGAIGVLREAVGVRLDVGDDAALDHVGVPPVTMLAGTNDAAGALPALDADTGDACTVLVDPRPGVGMLSVDVAAMLDATEDHAAVGLDWGCTVSEMLGWSPLCGVQGMTGVAVICWVDADSAVSDTMRVMGMKACPTPHSSEQNPVYVPSLACMLITVVRPGMQSVRIPSKGMDQP